MSPTKKTITMNLPTKAMLEKAMESGRARTLCQKVSRGMTSAVVFPIKPETGTIV